jgi:hypothetical protein
MALSDLIYIKEYAPKASLGDHSESSRNAQGADPRRGPTDGAANFAGPLERRCLTAAGGQGYAENT